MTLAIPTHSPAAAAAVVGERSRTGRNIFENVEEEFTFFLTRYRKNYLVYNEEYIIICVSFSFINLDTKILYFLQHSPKRVA